MRMGRRGRRSDRKAKAEGSSLGSAGLRWGIRAAGYGQRGRPSATWALCCLRAGRSIGTHREVEATKEGQHEFSTTCSAGWFRPDRGTALRSESNPKATWPSPSTAASIVRASLRSIVTLTSWVHVVATASYMVGRVGLQRTHARKRTRFHIATEKNGCKVVEHPLNLLRNATSPHLSAQFCHEYVL